LYALQDEELEISPVDIDDALVIEEDDISDDEDDDNEDVLDDSLPREFVRLGVPDY
jgi:E3 ubiquitin-protein ligase TRIP12